MDILIDRLKAAAEPTRLRLLGLLSHGELTVSEITQILHQSQPRVSRHLRLLGEAGLLDRLPEGSWVFYRVSDSGIRLVRELLAMVPADDPVMAQDRAHLDAIRRARAATAAAYFSVNAEHWRSIRSLHVDDAEVERALIDLLPPAAIHELLDIGTGTGRILEVFGERGVAGVGIDLSREMLSIARANLAKAGLTRCYVRQGDMYRLPWSEPSFDAITIHQVLHFADEPQQAIAEAARLLRPGGRMVIADFARHDLDRLRREHAHRRLGFADEEVVSWVRQAGLTSESLAHLPGKPLTVTLWPATKPA